MDETKDQEISLEEFMPKFQEEVNKFMTAWKEGQRTQPDNFAVSMTEGEWWQQVIEGWMS